jgi:hypothetical protein
MMFRSLQFNFKELQRKVLEVSGSRQARKWLKADALQAQGAKSPL